MGSYAARSATVMLAIAAAGGCVGGEAPSDPFALPDQGPSRAAASAPPNAPPSGAPTAGARGSHFPLVPGARWVYHHSGREQAEWDEVSTLEEASYEGQPAFALRGEEDAEGEQTTSLLQVLGSGVYRVHKDSSVMGEIALTTDYAPGFLRYDEAWSQVGQSRTLDDGWTQRCMFESIAKRCAPGAVRQASSTHIYEVVSLSTPVSVPAGTFDAVEIRRTNPGNLDEPTEREVKLFWFAKGVGKVREQNLQTDATEELTELTLP